MYSTSLTYFSPDFLSFLNIDFRNCLANSQIDIGFFFHLASYHLQTKGLKDNML